MIHKGSKYGTSILFLVTFLFSTIAFGYVIDDEDPEVTDRVARISFLEGDVQIRRTENEDWETAVLNLPLVEGDTIVAGRDARVEIQLNSRNYIRISQNSMLRLTALQDGSIAVSLQQGTALFRVDELDAAREFFEIDAPKTTVAVQRPGKYLVDASETGEEVRVTVYDNGEARVYSESSGFTLRSGRSARLYIDGRNVGEWDIAEAGRLDEGPFSWSSERDEKIANRLKTSYYDQYYDREIYGADELNDYGDWTYDRTYGYVWSPHPQTVSYYRDWSPYRYGHWRWIPPYGWVWVNDEPWGWATYHHGRWVWINGRWHWSPYGYYRHRRSWWRPALVYVAVVNRNICWYPLSYHHKYYNYNRHYARNDRRPRPPRNPGNVPTNPLPTPTPVPGGPVTPEPRGQRSQHPRTVIPDKGVITVPIEEWGRRTSAKKEASADVAKTVLSKSPDVTETPPILPTFEEVRRRPVTGVIAEKRPTIMPAENTKTGAAPRTAETPLDKELQRTRIFGNRPPVRQEPATTPEINTMPDPETRKTGAVERPPVRQPAERTIPIIVQPDRNQSPDNSKPADRPRSSPPIRVETPRSDSPKQSETPKYDPPQRRPEAPRSEPPRRSDPPPRTESPRSEPPRRNDPPSRSDPPARSDSPKSSPPAPKSEPSRPSTPSKGKDG